MRVATYVRVSTQQQDMRLQTAELGQYIASRGWMQADHYEDVMSGAKANRPGLARLIADAQCRRFDCVIVWKLDRFGRSLVDCLNNIRTLESAGVRFIATTQGLDTDQQNPASRFLLHVLGAAAEFERSLIRERVSAGMRAAKKSGTALGRPKGVFNREEVHELRRKGMSIAQISRQLNIGHGTVARTLSAA
jgi:DNA invertase Pin-like site-specific DNA recombinase